MVMLDEGADLGSNRGAVEAHHEELAHLPVSEGDRCQQLAARFSQ